MGGFQRQSKIPMRGRGIAPRSGASATRGNAGRSRVPMRGVPATRGNAGRSRTPMRGASAKKSSRPNLGGTFSRRRRVSGSRGRRTAVQNAGRANRQFNRRNQQHLRGVKFY